VRHSVTGTKRRAVLILAVAVLAGLVASPQGSMSHSAPVARAAGLTRTGAVSTDSSTPGDWSPAGLHGQGGSSPGRGNGHRADPCDHLPDPPGKANGIDKECPPLGSSGGVAKGDFNGDNFGDLAIGVPFEDIDVDPLTGRRITIVGAGAVNVIYGSANGLTTTDASVPPSQFWTQNSSGVLDSAESNDNFGWSLAAGDFDLDGFSDLAVGVPGEVISGAPGTGAVQVFYGSETGLTATGDELIANPVADSREFADSLVWADFDGDTVGDLAAESQGTSGLGIVSVFFGSIDNGLTTTDGLLVRGRQQFTFSNADAVTEAGPFVNLTLAAGKFNGDLFDDLVVGTPLADVVTFEEVPMTISDAGAVHVLYGSGNGLNETGGQFLHQESFGVPESADANDQFGVALAVGDFNGDNKDDLAVGVPNEDLVSGISDVGAVNVIYGSTGGLRPLGQASPPVPASQFWAQNNAAIPSEGGAEAGDHFGAALAAGDFNGDDFADLVIGVPDEDISSNTISGAGAVNVIHGSGSGLSTSANVAPQLWHQNSPGIDGGAEAGDRFGATLTAWNFGNFGKTDLAIGVPGEDVTNAQGVVVNDAGAVNVIYGLFLTRDVQLNPFVGLDATGDQLWHQGRTGVAGDGLQAGDLFGSALY
jgi:hypothetical protein